MLMFSKHDEEFEYCDDANRLDIQATEGLSPEEWAHPESAVVFSREDIEDGDYESAKQSIKEYSDYWAARNNRLKEKGVKEYLEKQGK